MAKFNSDDHYIYYCVQEAFRRSGIAFIVKKKKKECLGAILYMAE